MRRSWRRFAESELCWFAGRSKPYKAAVIQNDWTLYLYGYRLRLMPDAPPLKRLFWVGSSRTDLKALPGSVVGAFGYALYLAQLGQKHEAAKPLQGFGSAAVLEIVEDWQGNTYRAVYTLRFHCGVFVLHVFQKKSKRGTATPRPIMELIRRRLKLAEAIASEVNR